MITFSTRIIINPLRRIINIFRRPALKTTQKTGANFIATKAPDTVDTSKTLSDVDHIYTPRKIPSIFFKQLSRPPLNERSAADMSLDQAKELVIQAKKFYGYDFSLFSRSDFFYEEIEQDYLNTALGKNEKSIDTRFLNVMTTFRKVLNDNTRKLFLIYTPICFLFLMALTLGALSAHPFLTSLPVLKTVAGFSQNTVMTGAIFSTAILVLGLILLGFLYQWPYKVTQQRNIMGLDNYITSKFGRINQNFQVAKRRSLNVERNMRMTQAEQLKEESGIWSLSYHWLAMRLLLCEMTVRNKIYQIRRNTTLYSIGGMILCAMLAGIIWGVLSFFNLTEYSPLLLGVIITVFTLSFIAVTYGFVMRNAAKDMLGVMQTEEWNRFNLINLNQTIADHVGEDKLQIVTFRDRNRME